ESRFSRVEEVNGIETVRVALPDRMTSQTCVDCHNTHPDSPKKDWKLGDVRGVLEVSISIAEALAQNSLMSRNVSILAAAVALGILALLLVLMRSIGKRLKQTIQVMEAVATGDLEHHLEDTSKDEAGRMAVAVNKAVDSLREAAEERELQAQ